MDRYLRVNFASQIAFKSRFAGDSNGEESTMEELEKKTTFQQHDQSQLTQFRDFETEVEIHQRNPKKNIKFSYFHSIPPIPYRMNPPNK